MKKFTKEVNSQEMGSDFYFDSETPVANAIPVDYEMAVDEDFAEILHILGDNVMDDSPIAYPVASATTLDSSHSAHVVTAFPCFDGEGKTDEFDGFDSEWVENMDLDELQSFLYLQDIVEDDEERKVNDEDLMESTSIPYTNNNNYMYQPAIHVKSSDEAMDVENNNSSTAPPWERDEDIYSYSQSGTQSGTQSMRPVYNNYSQPLPMQSRRSFNSYVKEEHDDNSLCHKAKKGSNNNHNNKKGPAKTKEPPSSNSSLNLSRRQSATAQREREQGRFKKATCNWVSVTDLFEQ